MSIKFSNYVFVEPIPITFLTPPYRAGLYAILVPDITATPRPFRVIYFGESGNLSDRGFFKAHHKYFSWLLQAGVESNLYIAVYLMPLSTQEQRRLVESQLIADYRPVCNDGLGLTFKYIRQGLLR